ncbi:MAG: hypothetical protein K2F65_03485 [Eubacterium sp.]|nr:hypothetical protein [Eubacterium sp.]
MEYRLGTGLKIKDKGETVSLVCPKCDEKVNFHLFSNIENRLNAKFPFIKTSNVYFLICPKCAAVFTVDEAKGKSFDKGEKLSIGNFDFKTLKEFKNGND